MESMQPLAVDVIREAINGATNDEVLEAIVFGFETLAERAETFAEIFEQSDDRDVLNEAAVFVERALEIIPHYIWRGPPRISSSYNRLEDAKKVVAAEIREAREGTRGPRFAARKQGRRQSTLARRVKSGDQEAFETLDLSDATVLAALERCLDGQGVASVSDLARDLVGDAMTFQGHYWRRVVARITAVLRDSAKAGDAVQLRPLSTNQGRNTCRWTMPDRELADEVTERYTRDRDDA